MSNSLLKLVWGADGIGSPHRRLLLAALADHANDAGMCWPGIALLQRETDLSERTVRRAAHGLADAGWIAIKSKDIGNLKRGNSYVLNREKLQAVQRSTAVTVTGVNVATSVSVTGVQRSNEKSTSVSMTGVYEPPRTPKGTLEGDASQCDLFVLPPWVDVEAWEGFEDARKRMSKPMTPRARALALKELQKLRERGQDPAAVLNQSVMHGWLGLFPLRYEQNERGGTECRPVNALDKLREVA